MNNDFIKWLDVQFGKLPHLPANIRGVFIKIAPVLSLVFGILGMLASLSAMRILPIGGYTSSTYLFVSGAISLVSSVLLIMAYPKLKKMQHQGWVFLFWSVIFGSVTSFFPPSLGAFVGLFIGIYILFEIKSNYR